jgi:hypothetical protein
VPSAVQPVRIVEIAHRAFGQPGGEEGVDELADLVDARAQRRRDHHDEEALHPRGYARPAEPERDARPPRRRPQKCDLEEAARRHADRKRIGRLHAAVRHDDEGGEHRDVEQRGSEGRGGELGERVEDARKERDQADQQQIRESDPRQLDGEVELVAGIARCDRRHEQRHGELEQQSEEEQRGQEDGQHLLGELARLLHSTRPVQMLAEQRHETGREGALTEQPAEGVGQAESNQEGVGGPARAHDARHHHLAREAEDAAHHGEPADRADRAEKVRRLGGLGLAQAWPAGSPVASCSCCCAWAR